MAIIVNKNQEGNPILNFITNVPWQFGEVFCDYQVGRTTGVLFLSMRYHRLHPNYIYERLRQVGKSYILRVLVLLIDIKDPDKTIRELTRVSMILEFTVILAWSSEEAAKYIETFKAYENKPLDAIKKRFGNTFLERTSEFLTSAPSISKTDAASLTKRFVTLARLGKDASENTLKNIHGIGPNKISSLVQFLDAPLFEDSSKPS
jgi:DNA excision repair protein ERCC-1